MRVGLDRLQPSSSIVRELAGRRLGLLAHPASVDRSLVHISERLKALGVRPALIFGPEHGYGGEAQDMIGVAHAVDPSGARIVSLYGETTDDLVPSPADLASIDLLLIDLADVGSRYYTFVWTALIALRAAAQAGVQTIVLDRPNPIGGGTHQIEGAPIQPGYGSFVGWEPVPVRHGLTLGELLALYAKRDGLPDGALRVVPVEGWERAGYADRWDRPFVMTSPNMPSLETAVVYPGGCLIEGTNLSEGRGTTRPFEIVGAPFLDGVALARRLAACGLPGFVARPITFLPMFQKHARSICGGVFVHVTDRERFRPYATYLALVAFAAEIAGDAFAFRTERYEFIDTIPAFDLLTGSARAREAITARAPLVDWLEELCTPEVGWAETVQEAQRLVGQRSFAVDPER